MSDAGTVPVFSPDGTLGDIPYEQLHAAIAAGAKPGVNFTDPSGKPGVIPADQTQSAIKAGGKIVPFQNQETQHPGFWSAIADDMKGLLHPSGFSPYPGMDQEAKSAAAAQSSEQDQERKAAGYSGAYRAVAPVAQAVGVNVPGMEQSAKEGDVAGVAGHAAAPIVAMGAGEALAHSGPAIDAAAPVIRATARAVNKGLEKAPTTIGTAAGAAIGAASKVPFDTEIGAGLGAAIGKEVLPQVRIPGEGFGLPDRVEGGPTEAPGYEPPKAAAPVATKPAAATPSGPVSPAALEKQLNDALGGTPRPTVKPGVTMRNQATAGASLPEGFTPVKSSVLKGYKYNPEAQEFDGLTTSGQIYRHGQVTPEQFQDFEAADSKGVAWNNLRNQPGVTPLGKVDINGKLQPRVKPRSVVVDPETGRPEFSDVLQAKKKVAAPSLEPDEDVTDTWQQQLDAVMRSKRAKAQSSQ